MSTRQDSAPSPTVRSREELVAWIAAGSKPIEQWRIGTEHEKFLFYTDSLRPVPYDGPRGVRALMQGLIDRFGWFGVEQIPLEWTRVVGILLLAGGATLLLRK